MDFEALAKETEVTLFKGVEKSGTITEGKPDITKMKSPDENLNSGAEDKKNMVIPDKMWEDLARQTERDLGVVDRNGIEICDPKSIVYAAKFFKGWSKERINKTWDSMGGEFDKCVKKAKSFADDPEAYCSALEKAATGKFPTEK